ncbi:NADH-quinone oxidoreductase subunit L [Nonomuraea sp. B12E4]|uniref:NADH-quinone oxidoreductase subunit L n=1 Tax=Nonomuraea sp. B12E4 TaxID=3153564 RepID=UPI00325ED001
MIAFPLVGAFILLVFNRFTNRWGHLLGVAMSLASFVVAVLAFFELIGFGEEARRRAVHLFEFIPGMPGEPPMVDMGLLIDPLSISFALLITGVGSLIHIYSIGYMSHDEHRRRFFSYLNLFVAAMLLLVLADNYVGLFIGWEGVGLASYLLIGFWQFKPSAATAAKKAFVVNRVGDFGLLVGMFVIWTTFGSLAFKDLAVQTSGVENGTTLAIGLLLLLGACGKSAQLPLQSWLLDAMEGPTPVSALIHAATMVTAGVYLVVRSGAFFFHEGSGAALAVAIVGAATLLAGAIIGCAKDDIKKGLAGSTMSQIGYMMLGAGLGPAGYAFAIGHLITHGFFKADMFLGAGSVMHGMNDEVDMRKYGALRKAMPITFVTFFIGYLAIIGFPLLSGYFTKDGIIETAVHHQPVLGWLAVLGAGITGFYMSRMVFMTFFGQKRWADDAHPHESPAVMTWPLIILSIGAIFLGGYLILSNTLMKFLGPAVGLPEELPSFHFASVPGIVTLVLVAIGAGFAWTRYGRVEVPAVQPRGSFLTTFARRDLYGDALNESLFMRPGQWLTRIAVFFDNRGIDGLVNGLAAGIGGSSGRLRRIQTGFARTYALSILIGAALLTGALLLVGNL